MNHFNFGYEDICVTVAFVPTMFQQPNQTITSLRVLCGVYQSAMMIMTVRFVGSCSGSSTRHSFIQVLLQQQRQRRMVGGIVAISSSHQRRQQLLFLLPRLRDCGPQHLVLLPRTTTTPTTVVPTTQRRWNHTENNSFVHRQQRQEESSTSSSSSPLLLFDVVAPDAERLPIIPSSSLSSVVESPQKQKPSIMTKLQKWLTNSLFSIQREQDTIVRAEMLFQAAKFQASDPRWFGPGRIGRDFRSRHALLTFHIWLLHKRLLLAANATNSNTDNSNNGDSAALDVDAELFSILWDDTTCRIRQAGVYELSVNKHLLQVQQYTFLHLTHYDHCFSGPLLEQPVERIKELRHLVYHHWFHTQQQQQDDPNANSITSSVDYLDRICWYIDANYRNILLELPNEYYRTCQIAWVDLPDFTQIRNVHGHVVPDVEVNNDDVLPTPWLRNITRRGVEYYWNPNTGESTYDKPTNDNSQQLVEK